jgi:hypothetical protein
VLSYRQKIRALINSPNLQDKTFKAKFARVNYGKFNQWKFRKLFKRQAILRFAIRHLKFIIKNE